jgi:hypothetical protein
MKRLLLVVLACLVTIPLASPANAQEVLAGIDLFETDSDNSFADLADLHLLAPGCFVTGDPMIKLKGIPLLDPPICPGNDLGGADTIVRRPNDTAGLDINPVMIDIEIVEMHLQSVQPFEVDCGGELQQWMLDIEIDPLPQPQGQMFIQKLHPNGGDFQYQPLLIEPRFIFTRIDLPPPFIAVEETIPIPLFSNPTPWVYTPEAGSCEVPGCTSNFFPGVDPGGGLVADRVNATAPPVAMTMAGGILTWTE